MIRRSCSNPRRLSGFTLVELLLAITLMSILLGLTYTGLRAAARSSERGEIILAAGGEMRASHQFVRRQINQMLPLSFAVTDDINAVRIVFVGDANHIQYVAPMPGYLGSGGPQVQLLELASDNEGNVLQFSHALLQGYEEGLLFERDPVILLENVESAGFEFLGQDEDGEVTGWVSSWDKPDILPVAVRLNLAFSDETQMLWPDLVAGVRLDESAVKGEGGRVRNNTYKQRIQDLIKGKDKDKS
jgi:general secretion pathway protein J